MINRSSRSFCLFVKEDHRVGLVWQDEGAFRGCPADISIIYCARNENNEVQRTFLV